MLFNCPSKLIQNFGRDYELSHFCALEKLELAHRSWYFPIDMQVGDDLTSLEKLNKCRYSRHHGDLLTSETPFELSTTWGGGGRGKDRQLKLPIQLLGDQFVILILLLS